MQNKVFWVLIVATISFVQAQEGAVTNHIYEGNSKVKEEAFSEAEKAYRKALSIAPEKATALWLFSFKNQFVKLRLTWERDPTLDSVAMEFPNLFATELFRN